MLDSRRVEMDAIGASPARGRSRLFSGFSLRRVLGTVRPSSAAGLIGMLGMLICFPVAGLILLVRALGAVMPGLRGGRRASQN